MIAALGILALFAGQVDPSVRDKQALVEHIAVLKAGGADAIAPLKAARVTIGRQIDGSSSIVDSTATDFVRAIAGCTPEASRGGESYRQDGSSSFHVDWTCANDARIVTQVEMRDGNVTNLHWTQGLVVILSAPPVAR